MTERAILEIINQVFEIRKKQQQNGYEKIERNIDRLVHTINEEGYRWKDPTGEMYSESRTDCTATILSDQDPMIISETLKPIVSGPDGTIVQQGRVIIR